jgi:hypothetical protein
MTEIFLAREALGDGLSRKELRRFYRPLFRGVHVPKWANPDLYDRILGAWLTSDRTGIIAGVAASALHGAAFVDDDELIEILADERRRQTGLLVRTDRVADNETMTLRGVAVTTPARTAFDIGRYVSRPDALGRLDALYRAAPFRIEDVESLIARYGPVRGVRQLRELLPLVDAGAESLKESWLRLLLIDAGLPAPETQIPVVDGTERFAYLDMGWRDFKLAVEYDGDHHRTDRASYVRDLRRLPKVEARGWEVIRIIKEDRPAEIKIRVCEAYRRRAETDEIPFDTRTLGPVRRFGREEAA